MSVTATTWAIEQGRRLKLPVSERMLLIAISERTNGVGFCWPGQKTLADDTGLSARWVQDLAPALERRGLIRIEKVGRSLRYYLVRPNGAYDPAPIPEPASTIKPEPTSGLAVTPYQSPEPSSALIPEPSSAVAVNTGTLHHGYRNPVPLIPEPSSTEPKKEPSKKENQERKEDPPNPPQAGGHEILSPWFAVFWDLYPRKVGKRTAQAAFNAAVNRGNSAEAIVAGLQGYQFHPDPQFQPHPTTWLRGDRWLDEVDSFDPVLRAAGLSPDDFRDRPPGRLLQ